MHSISKVLLICAVIALCGCSGSESNNLPGGRQCDNGYDPLPQKVGPAQKEVRKDAKDPAMPRGRYTYNFSDLVYSQIKKPDPFTVQVHDNAAAGVSVGQAVSCMNNLPAKVEVTPFEMDAVTDIIICNDGHQVITTRHFKFDVTNATLHFKAPEKNSTCMDSTVGAYPKGPFLILKSIANPADFEVRSEVVLDDGSAKYDLGVHMAYTAYADNSEPPECANKCLATPADRTSVR